MTLHSVIGTDQVQDSRVSRSGRLATDQKAVQRRGPGRVVLASKPQLATAEKLVSWAARAAGQKLVRWAATGNPSSSPTSDLCYPSGRMATTAEARAGRL